MTTRVSDIVPEVDPVMAQAAFDATAEELAEAAVAQATRFTECEFDDCNNPTSYQMKDRFGFVHKSCTDCKDSLIQWVRIHNGWEEAAADDGPGPTLP